MNEIVFYKLCFNATATLRLCVDGAWVANILLSNDGGYSLEAYTAWHIHREEFHFNLVT